MDHFDPTREPMRAIRDLIMLCELTISADHGGDAEEQAILECAQAGFTHIRKLFGDNRLAEQIAVGPMIEPDIASVPALTRALQMASGALRLMERRALFDPQEPIRFTGKWGHFGTLTISDILDQANEALASRETA
jgi:hypothetical protein